MNSIVNAYRKCEKTVTSCETLLQLESGYKMVDQFNYLYKEDKNFKTYSNLLSATLHMKSNKLK